MDVVNWAKAAAYLGSGICMGIGAVGPALGQGFAAGKACEAISNNPENSGYIRMTLIICLGFIETSSIYALVVSLCLIFMT